jgi:putative ABC transport system permease protein
VIPAWQASRVNLNQSLKDGGRSNAGSAKSRRLRGGLVVAEIALSLVVLIGAGLLVKSFVRLLNVDPGFVTENLLTTNIGLFHFKEPSERVQKQHAVLERIAALPGVQAVGGGTGLPPVTPQRGTRFAVQGLPNDNVNERSGYFIAISPDYFRALGTKVLQGRVFSARDDAPNAPVVIINQALAARLFPNESALGKRLQLINPEQSNEWREVVGVVADITYSGLDDRLTATIYTPFAQTPFLWNYLMIRTAAAPETLVNSVRQAIVSVDERLEPVNFQPMQQVLYDTVAQPRFYTVLLGAFAGLSLLLAAVGIYGVLAYSVTQRTHELGVRLALGAQRRDVLRLIVREGMGLALLGVGAGLAGAYAATKAMTSLLFEVQATDLTTYAVIAVLLLFVALLASLVPALRAMNVDPIIALRGE